MKVKSYWTHTKTHRVRTDSLWTSRELVVIEVGWWTHENSCFTLFKILTTCFIFSTKQIRLPSLMAGFLLHSVCFTKLLPRFHRSPLPGKPETLLSVIVCASVKSGGLVSDRKHGDIQSWAWETQNSLLKGVKNPWIWTLHWNMYWVHFTGSAHLHYRWPLAPKGYPDPNAASLQQHWWNTQQKLGWKLSSGEIRLKTQ